MSPLSQSRLLLPLLEAIRDHLGPGEHAALRRTTYGSPCITAHTVRGSMTASVDEDGLYALAAPGGRYVCDPNAPKASIYNTIRRALTDAREERS